MPWSESTKMDEKLKFVARYLDGESISDLCREFVISRVTGHKVIARYRESGLEALTDRSRRPVRFANQLPFQVEQQIVKIKQQWPRWGAPKIRERLISHFPDIPTPATSTVHAVLDRHGLVNSRRPGRTRAKGTTLSTAQSPNQLWCTDYKGEFMLGDRRYCYPLTVTDFSSRFLLCCEAMESTREQMAITAFERLFREFGLPDAIRSDNGVPFSSPHAIHGLSKLSVYWLRLGIAIERIKPGNPQQNGRHERMHRTLKQYCTRPAGMNMLQQQEMFERFIDEYNNERPHQALEMKRPVDLYRPSNRPYNGVPPVSYPFHDKTVTITACGRICVERKKIHLSTVLAGHDVGIRQVDERIWLVSFMSYDLGYFDLDSCRVEPIDNPFGPRVLTMSPE